MKRGDIKTSRVIGNNLTSNKLFSELVEEFIRSAEIGGLAEWTIKSYKYHTGYFMDFTGRELMCKDVGIEIVENYIDHMMKEKGLTNPVTLNSYVRNLSPIIKYGIRKRYILNDFQMPVIRGQETIKEIYTNEELQALLSKPDMTDFVNLRTYTIIWVLASTGVRARELRELRIKNVDLVNRAITANQTKNKKPRRLPISNSLHEVLTQYIEIRGSESEDYLFPTIYNDIMAMSSLQDSVKKYCNNRGVYKTSLHLFRHTFITNAVNQNVNPLMLKRITGHSSMAQLNNYYNAKTTDLVDVIDDIAPKLNKKHKFFK